MAIAVVGFDLGYLNSYVACARAGGIETVTNEYSDRCTTTCVSFTDTIRFIGNSAKQRLITNMRETVHGFTQFVGRSFDDPRVQEAASNVPYKIVKTEGGGVGFQVNYLNESAVFTPEQMTAMMLTKLKSVAQSNLGTAVVDCVLNVPTYYNDRQRRALLDATQIAGLNCLKLINDLTAIGLNYGIYKKDMPPADKPPKIVAFVDMGHSSLQVALIAFNEGQMKVLSTACDSALGGRNLDRVIFEYFADDFASRMKLNVRSNPKATLKLLEECGRVKKLMSANSTDIPLGIECLMEDRDVNGRINRETFQSLLESAGILRRIEDCLSRSLALAKLTADKVDGVEIVGGSTRVPIVKELVAKVFGQTPKTTLNADESVARGCALMCAILSPAFKVREFSITDWQPYGISLSYKDNEDKEENVEVFPVGYQFPMSRTLTLYQKAAFELAAFYNDEAASDRLIGKFVVGNVQPDQAGNAAKVKVKVRVNSHGIFTLSQAKLVEVVEKVEEVPEEKMETDAAAADGAKGEPAEQSQEPPQEAKAQTPSEAASSPMDTDAAAQEPPAEQPKVEKKIKKVTKYTDLPIEVDCVKQLSKKLLTDFQEREGEMVLQESREQERCLAKNSVEEYVYDMRDKMYSQLEKFVTESERESFSKTLTDTEDWLYGDGENVARQVYVDKLAELRQVGDRFCRRAQEAADRPKASEALGRAIQHARKIVDAWRAKDETFSHLGEEEMAKVVEAADAKQQWMITQLNEQEKLPPTADPKITGADIRAQLAEFESLVSPILNRPKPKVEPPPEQAKAAEGEQQQQQQPPQEAAPDAADPAKKPAEPKAPEAKVNGAKEADMDLD